MLQAAEWSASRNDEDIITAREDMIASLERADAAIRESGLRDRWFDSATPSAKKVAGDANGHLFRRGVHACF